MKSDLLKEKIRSGFMLEREEDMSEDYLEALKQTLVIVSDTELMSVPALLSAYKYAPTLNTKITALAVVQDEIGHAHIASRLLRDLGVDTDQLLNKRPANKWKNPFGMDFKLSNWIEFGVFNAFFDRAGYALLGDAYENQSYAPWKRALAKVDKEELFHLRNGETIMRLAMEHEETRLQVERAVEWMFFLAYEFFGVSDEKKSRSAQLEFKLKGKTNDELRQRWLSTAVPFCESIGVKVPAHYDENAGKYVVTVPFPCKFDMENKKWLYDQPQTWEEAIARWKNRGPDVEDFVEKLQRGNRELEALRQEVG